MIGWFSISRKLLGSDLWLAEKFTRGQAWVDLIGLARYENDLICLKGVEINLLRGQLARSESNLAKRWRWSRGKVRRFLSELETEHRIVQQKSNVTTVITLVKYEQYQRHGTAASTASGTAENGTANGTANSAASETANSTAANAGSHCKASSIMNGIEEGSTANGTANGTADSTEGSTRMKKVTNKQFPPQSPPPTFFRIPGGKWGRN